MDQVKSETQLIAYCGLFCANCARYKKGKCPGCAKYEKATWCKIRTCCIEKGIANCSDCEEFINPKDCKKYDTFISGVMEFFTSTDRSLNVDYLRKNSTEKFIVMMNEKALVSLPKMKKGRTPK